MPILGHEKRRFKEKVISIQRDNCANSCYIHSKVISHSTYFTKSDWSNYAAMRTKTG